MTNDKQPLPPEQVIAALEAAGAANPSPIRRIAQELIRSGEVRPETTFAEGLTLLEKHFIVQ